MNQATAGKGRANARRFLLVAALALWAGFGFAPDVSQTAKPGQTAAAPPSEITVALKEVPVWEIASERVRSAFLRGQYTVVQQGTSPSAKYPKFTSETPLYGQISFQNVSADSRASRNCSFALDSATKGGDYDLLYFDDKGDGNLTDAKPRHPLPQSDRLIRRSSSLKETYFEPVQVTFRFGPAGARPLELLPRLLCYQGDRPQFSFVAARVHTGTFTIDGTSYQAFVGYQYTVGAPLDQPSTTCVLAPQGGEPVYWWGGDELCAAHRLGGRFYRFSCTPTGDKLTVRPYTGPVGTLEVGAGGRKVEKVQMSGSLRSKEMAVAVGDVTENGWPGPTPRCEIPVGDYYPAIMTLVLDNIQVTVSNNYHVNAQGESRRPQGPVAGITVRPDKPCVLDFSNKPVVVFTEPAATAKITPGSEVTVKAVLIDPELDVMIRRLNDTAQTEKQTLKTADGKGPAIERPKSLDPQVVVARANGEIVAEGVMPFGWDGTCGYSWRVPNDLKLSDDKETFTITVTYETQELYGTVKGQREIVIAR